MRLYKKSNSPYWWMDFRVGSQRIRRSTKRLLNDKKSAQRYMAQEYERLMNFDQLGEKPEITIQEALEVTLAEVSGQTHRIYRASGNAFIKVWGPDKSLSRLSSSDLDQFVKVRKKAGLKPNSVRSDLKALKRIINRVRLSHKVQMDVSWPKVGKFTKSRYLSEAEEREVLLRLSRDAQRHITARKAHFLCVFLLDTGVRLMEAIDIPWANISMNDRLIEVYRPKTKTLSVLPMTERVHKLLLEHSAQDRPFMKMNWAIRLLRRTIDEVCNQDEAVSMSRGKATIHSLRDTFASRLLKRGITIYKLSKLMGHSTVSMTEKCGHLEMIDVVKEARKLMSD